MLYSLNYPPTHTSGLCVRQPGSILEINCTKRVPPALPTRDQAVADSWRKLGLPLTNLPAMTIPNFMSYAHQPQATRSESHDSDRTSERNCRYLGKNALSFHPIAHSTGLLFTSAQSSATNGRLFVDPQPRPRASVNPKTMPTPPSDLTELPIEILERILLCLPGQDIIKIEMVRSVTAVSIQTFVNFALYDPGQPTHSRSRS